MKKCLAVYSAGHQKEHQASLLKQSKPATHKLQEH
jgi:hypothetical protein